MSGKAITGNARNYKDVGPPSPAKRTIFDCAEVIETSDPHDLLGIEYETAYCGKASRWDEALCETAPSTTKDQTSISTVAGDPFTVYSSVSCAPFGHSPEEMEAKAKDTLLFKEHMAVEQHLEEWLIANGTPVAADPVVRNQAIGAVEGWLGEVWAGDGLILASPFAASLLAVDGGLFWDDSSGLVTACGTSICVGNFGELGVGVHIYAVPRLILVRGPVFTALAPIDTANVKNLTVGLAERTYVPLFECGAASCEVLLS
ncbi:MAG: hypothetical protein E4H38_00885 [Gemmatimonadales bacterium]|nr:MAG: hypothetical protein E4H38_00885 [Gemmatimonadales bacterium]